MYWLHVRVLIMLALSTLGWRQKRSGNHDVVEYPYDLNDAVCVVILVLE